MSPGLDLTMRLLRCDHCDQITAHDTSKAHLRCLRCLCCWGCGRPKADICESCQKSTKAFQQKQLTESWLGRGRPSHL